VAGLFKKTTQQFEYKLLKTGRDDQGNEEALFNKLGEEGWEAISVDQYSAMGFHAWFKRVKS
jgi:hypothetical protein